MKKFFLSGLIAVLLISSVTVSAQYGRHYGRGNNRYSYNRYSYNHYPSRSSISIIARLPFGAVSVTFGDRYYHYYNGVYYRPYNRGYMIVPPPVGIIVPGLPLGYTHVIIGSNPYYRHGDVFYAPYGNRYKVVEKPKETDVASTQADKTDNLIAGDYEKVVLEGKTYYKKGDKYYKASVNKNGEIVYEEVGETSKSK
jgi:hypothetical protein